MRTHFYFNTLISILCNILFDKWLHNVNIGMPIAINKFLSFLYNELREPFINMLIYIESYI